jgi:hypothetical protein
MFMNVTAYEGSILIRPMGYVWILFKLKLHNYRVFASIMCYL